MPIKKNFIKSLEHLQATPFRKFGFILTRNLKKGYY
jgi:hypothetical protein